MSDSRELPKTRRFEILREIGSGGASRVYLARDRYTGAGPLALKVLDAGGPKARVFRALEEEFLPLRDLSHPGLVQVYERGVIPETGEPYYTSEYLEGSDFVAATRGLGVERLLDLAVQVLRTLEHIHRRGYVHCDLKPGNILVTREGETKVLDFGLAAREGDVEEEGTIRGTLPYLAPETLAGRPVDRRSDLYSFGVVLFQALVGKLPERGEDLLPVFPEDVLLRLPVPFDSLLHRLLPRDPAERPASAAKVLELLSSYSGRQIPVQTEAALAAQLATGRFVGREIELGTLMAELRNTLLGAREGGARRLLLVRGEAGSGKRRLLLEFRDRCQREGVDFFSARCIEGQAAAYAPFEPVLRALLARVGEDSARARVARPALARILPGLAPGEDGADSPPPLSGQEERLRWLDEVVQFLRAASQGGTGYVLAIEDVHRASREMVELIAYLARTLCMAEGSSPSILIVVSMRDEEDVSTELTNLLADLAAEDLVLPVELRRFGESEVSAYVSSTVGIEDPPKRLVRTLCDRTGGNVFFLEQLLKALVEEGTITYRNDRWRVGDLARVRVPDSVVSVLERRLRTLSAAERALLEVVACYGEPMPKRVLGEVLTGSTGLLRPLILRQVLMETEDARALFFRHKLVAQLVLSEADPRHLRHVHGELGRVLEALPPEDAVRPEKVAHHVSLGEDRRRALRFALDTAGELERQGKHDEAAIFHVRALARLERADPRRPELLVSLGDAHVGSGRLELAADAYREACQEGGGAVDRATVHRKLAEVLERTGEYSEALLHVKAGLDLVDPGDAGTRIPLLRLLGAIHRQRDDYHPAIECIREGLRLARGRPSEETASLLSLLGNVYMRMGEHRKALNFHLRSLRFARTIGFEAGAAAALHNLGTLLSAWGDSDRAFRYYSDSLRITERLRNLPAVALTYNNLANLVSEAGDFERAEYYHRRCLAIRRRIGDPFGIAMSFGNIGSMHRLRGQWGLAYAYYERSIRHFLRIGNEYGAAQFRSHLADLLLLVGHFDRASELIEQAWDAAARHDFRRIQARAERLGARLARHREELAEARRRIARAGEMDRALGNREGGIEGGIELALVHRARGRRGQALRAVAGALEASMESRSETLAAECRLLRGMLGGGGEDGADRPRQDVDAFVEYAERTRRPDSLARGLEVRAAMSLAAGDLEAAADDAREALRLTEGIATGLPEDLADVYRRDPRRRRLSELGEKIHEEIGRAGGNVDAAGLLVESDSVNQENLKLLLEINKRLNSETDLAALLDFIMDSAVELTGAERGFLILFEERKPSFQVARNFRRKEIQEPELKVSRSIVQQVMKTGEPVLTDNATEDERFKNVDSIDGLKLKSIVSVPFQSRNQRIGAIYLDNPARNAVFSEDDVETLKALSDQAAIAIQNLQRQAKLAEKIEAQDVELSRVKQVLDERTFRFEYDEIIGRSSRMKEVFLLLDKIIDTEVPVLIQGESGTGKELVARAIHYKGPRKAGSFVTVNCGAVPENLLESEFFGYVRGAFTGANSDKTGLFVQADKGTFFLDEIGDMDFEMQKKLLRVLQQGEVRPVGGKATVKVDVRIVCATNKDLRQRMLEKKFREDLYYRINVISVHLPPLRERREDIPLLAQFFVGKTAEEMGLPLKVIDQEAMALLTAYSWPGNVRELENEVKKVMALSDDRIVAEDLSPHIQGERASREPSSGPSKGTLKETMEATEKSIITRALEETGGNQTRAAKVLGISRVWLRKKMEKYGLLD